MSDIVRLRIALEGTEPPIWRRVDVPANMSLKELHSVIQAAMGWQNMHLYHFQAGRQRIIGPGLDDLGGIGARSVGAGSVLIGDLTARGITRFSYVYDMGDNWEHTIEIEQRLSINPALAYPRLIDGALRCPPEDCGGIPGFYDFLDAINDPKHPRHDDLVDWYGDMFDANVLDIDGITKKLGRIAARRKAKSAKRTR
jgi:Plasmid pRiA4b ORF-3-like protein